MIVASVRLGWEYFGSASSWVLYTWLIADLPRGFADFRPVLLGGDTIPNAMSDVCYF